MSLGKWRCRGFWNPEWVLGHCKSQQWVCLVKCGKLWAHIHVTSKRASQSPHSSFIIDPSVHRIISDLCTACFRVQFILDIYCNALTNTYPYTLFLMESRSTLCEVFHTLHGYYSSELYHKYLISLIFDILFLKLDFRTNVCECLPPVALPPSVST